MSNIKELMMSASAGNAEASNVEDLFSIDLWNGNSSTQDIVNGIDLATYGGMLWHKVRDATFDHVIRDSERTQGITKAIHPNTVDPEGSENGVYAFNTNGYSLSNDSAAGRTTNTAGYSYIGYTFRKAARFFDIQTWTGDGVSGRQISHSLQATPGAIFIKKLSAGGDDWSVYHRSMGVNQFIRLNSDVTKTSGTEDVQAVSASTFTIGNDSRVNGTSNDTYVAYIFAHHNNDGVFGPNGNLDIIKCGSWTGNNATQEVDIGFEPAFLLWKNIDVSGNYWVLVDNKREWSTELSSFFRVNGNHAEADVTTNPIIIDGGKIYINNAGGLVNGSGEYIYIAVRRATAIPEQADDVFALSSGSGTPRYQSGFHTDFVLERKLDAIQTMRVGTRLLGKGSIFEVSTGGAPSANAEWDFMNGYDGGQGLSNEHAFMWKRAPKYFDVVHYRGSNGNAAFEHQLGIAPSMIWIKNQTSGSWIVGSKYFHNTSTGWDKELELNNSVQENSSTNFQNGSGVATAPTATQFFVTPNTLNVNRFLYDYFAYVFGEVPGISKMGRYTSNGSNQNIECGFQPSFVMIRIIDATYGGNWYMFDTLRGINTNANDPAIYISDNTVPANNTDFIDLYSTGFTVKDSQINDPVSPYKDYFFYAIA